MFLGIIVGLWFKVKAFRFMFLIFRRVIYKFSIKYIYISVNNKVRVLKPFVAPSMWTFHLYLEFCG